jgi:hypothetical protein
MKNKVIYISLFLFVTLILSSCKQDTGSDKMTKNNKQTVFNNLDEASKKAKSDLLEVLKQDKEIKLNIDPKQLEQSNPEGSVKHYMVDINKFVAKDSIRNLKDVSTDEGVSIVPFVYNKKVIASASINKVKDGWTVGGLFNNKITSDVNKVKQIQYQIPKSEINYYEVPNIDAHIYQVVSDTSAQYFTDYKSIFSIEKGARLAEIVNVMRKDAIDFQRKYEKELKENKLVK